MTLNKLLKLQESCVGSQHGCCPHVPVDFTKDNNPYRAHYGETWQKEIKKVQLMSPYICIAELINHIMSATKEVISGTKYKGQELFFHDALSLMTAKDTVTWMKEKGIYEHWILPEIGCYDLLGKNKSCYAKRPVGNSPELMCLDMSLNKDVRECLRMHVSITQHLEKADPYRFSMSTPKEISRAISRLVHPSDSGVVLYLSECLVKTHWNFKNIFRIHISHPL